VLVFDGDCGFCTRSAEWVVRLGCDVDIVPWQRFDLAAVGLTAEEAAAKVRLVDGTRTWAGHEAIGHTLTASRHVAVRLLGRVVLTRVLAPFAARVYAWVSAHRHRLPGGTPACALPRDGE
jgi:predicted DCC family thiol-disulfide oxidoreductase YuxK